MAINVEAFYDMINGIAKQQVQATPMDLTIDAKISKLYNVDIGEYKVEYQGNIFSAFTQNPEVTYNVGERVYVLVPQGDFSTKKVILGYSKYESNLSEADRIDLSNQYVIQGPNWYEVGGLNYRPDHHPLQICSVPESLKPNLSGEGYYEDVGFQRELLMQETVDTLEKYLAEKETYTPEKLKTARENLKANTGDMLDYIDSIDATLYQTSEEYRTEVQSHLNRLTEAHEQFVNGVAIVASRTDTNNVDLRFQNYSSAYDYMMISADFRTQFVMPHFAGQYYLSVMFWCENPKYCDLDNPAADLNRGEQNFILKELRLGFNQFNGSPYTFIVDTPQKAFYRINPGEFRGLYRVALMQDGNLVADITPTYDEETGALQYDNKDAIYNKPNIFCDNIDIRFAKKIDMVENPYYCYIETPHGDSFFEKSEDHPIPSTRLTLVPHYIHLGQEITQDCEIEWFREDLSVFPSTPTDKDEYGKIWTDYTGAGWRPIADLADEDMGYWKVGPDGVLTVYNVSTPWRWRFKCVCKYNQQEDGAMIFGSAVQEVINKDSEYDLYLEEITSPNSNVTSLRINENAPRRVGLDVIPNSGDTLRQEWFGTWYVELADGSYIEIDNDTPIKRGPIAINTWLTYDMVTFRVACYDPRKVWPPYGVETKWHDANPIGYLEKTFMNNVDGNVLVEWIGRRSFNYTALGNAYPDISINEYTLQPKLKWNLDPMNYHMVIMAPDGSMLGSRNYYNQQLGTYTDPETGAVVQQSFANISGKGYDCNGKSMMTDMYIDSDNVVHFKVRAELEPTLTLNTFTARILTIADGTWYEAPCEVLFTKDGQSGTQGSGWTAPLKQVDMFENGKVAYDPVTNRNITIASPAYTTPIGYATVPLVVERTVDEEGKEKFVQVNENVREVVLRPFPTKEGRDLMAYTGTNKGYKIVIDWDVRYPQQATVPQAQNSSFLRLYDAATRQPIDMHQELDVRGTTFNNDGKRNPSKGEYSKGLIGQTFWDGTPDDQSTKDRNKFYGSVIVKFVDNGYLYRRNMLDPIDRNGHIDGSMDMFAKQGFYLVVKATIHIYSNDPGDFPKTANSDLYNEAVNKAFMGAANSSQDEKGQLFDENGVMVQNLGQLKALPSYQQVKTIVSYYAVDLFIKDKGSMNFDPMEVRKMNWPTEIQYDPQGGNPQVRDEYLEFVYGEGDNKFVVPTSLIPSLATVEQNVADLAEDDYIATDLETGQEITIPGNGAFDQYQSNLQKRSESKYKYRPITSINWNGGNVGALFGRIEDEQNNVHGSYYRNQVLMMNMFGNLAINNWDGHSITLDDENGVILAPQIAAGFKNDFTNKFYGVVMGKNTSFPRVSVNADGSLNLNKGGIDQLAMVGATLDEQLQENAMTGLFGYQNGVPSFGLLENGTAFFGRLDRGGGIIIDGYNAVIYGGANGVVSSPKIGDNMWNSMRLTMVDLSHATNKETYTAYDQNGKPTKMSDEVDIYDEFFFDENGEWKNEYPTMETMDDDGLGKLEKNQQPVTTPLRGLTQGFEGSCFANGGNVDDPYGVLNQLPHWYKMVWVGAYIKPKNRSPYWYQEQNEDEKGKTEVWVKFNTENNMYEPVEPDAQGDIRDSDKEFFIPNPEYVPSLEFLSQSTVGGVESFRGAALADSVNASRSTLDYLDMFDEDHDTPLFKNSIHYEHGHDNYAVDYWSPSIKQIRAYMDIEDGVKGGPVSGFGPSRASTTPAIEIGQHPTGLMPGLIPLDYPLEKLFKDIYIPGDRNFMVTYDGTMWAMNGVFLGNVIGSNIIGGRINGAQIGIGDNLTKKDFDKSYWIAGLGDWGTLCPPEVVRGDNLSWYYGLNRAVTGLRENFQKVSQINPTGDSLFKRIFMMGGEIHVGTFHILGRDDWTEKYAGSSAYPYYSQEQEGHLIQLGVSDFLGPTHFYGSVGIGPSLVGSSTDIDLGANRGNLLQVRGLVSLGIILPLQEGTTNQYNFKFHQEMAKAQRKMQSLDNIWYMDRGVTIKTGLPSTDIDPLLYTAKTYNYGVTNIGMTDGLSIEQMSMFSLYTKDGPVVPKGQAIQTNILPGISYQRVEALLFDFEDLCYEMQRMIIKKDQTSIWAIASSEIQILQELNRIRAAGGEGQSLLTGAIEINGDVYQMPAEDNYKYIANDHGADYQFVVKLKNLVISNRSKYYSNSDIKNLESTKLDPDQAGYVGHFWPMSFRYFPPTKEQLAVMEGDKNPYDTPSHAFLTTMDIFASKGARIGNGGSADKLQGANYFRVGPWGTEGTRFYFCSGWQSEIESQEPMPERMNWEIGSSKKFEQQKMPSSLKDKKESFKSPRGFIGVGKGGGGGTDGPPVIFETWGMSKMFLRSDNEISLQAIRGWNGWEGNMDKEELNTQHGYQQSTMSAHRVNLIFNYMGNNGFGIESNFVGTAEEEDKTNTNWTSYATSMGVKTKFDKADAEGKQHEYLNVKAHYTVGVGLGNGLPNSNMITGRGMKTGVGGCEKNHTLTGLQLDPQDVLLYNLPNKFNGGHGGAYFYGKAAAGVHIMHFKGSTNAGLTEDGKHTELFLYREQASLTGEGFVYIGNYPTNYEKTFHDDVKPSAHEGFEQGAGVSHAPDTKEGTGMLFIEGTLRSASRSAFTFVAGSMSGGKGQDLVTSENAGWSTSTNGGPAMGIGGGAEEHMEIFHKKYINIHAHATVGKFPYADAGIPGISIGQNDNANYILYSDGKGAFIGNQGTIRMHGTWANPDNQYCIYARFG